VVNCKKLARELARSTGLKQKECEVVLRALHPTIAQMLRNDEKVNITGLGIFSTRVRKPWTGTNPLTGEPMGVQPQRVPVFKPSKSFHDLEI
jgi:integration host factor subunit beta